MITAECDYIDKQTGRPRIVKRIPAGSPGVVFEVYQDNILFLKTMDGELAVQTKRKLCKGIQPATTTTYQEGTGI
ncbi:MAG: hypothetical protein K9M45_01550 [Kiritimatiellales bacterium]|nr:hypothetical protein [Kiritimatiellales bacterium]